MRCREDFCLAETWCDDLGDRLQVVQNLPAMEEMQARSLGQEDPLENGNPPQYSCLENSIDRGT